MDIASTEGPGGRVDDVLIDRDRLTLTHVVLTPRILFAFPRLVPAEAIDPGGPRPSLTWSTQRMLECPVIRHVARVGLGESVSPEDGSDSGVIQVSARAETDLLGSEAVPCSWTTTSFRPGPRGSGTRATSRPATTTWSGASTASWWPPRAAR